MRSPLQERVAEAAAGCSNDAALQAALGLLVHADSISRAPPFGRQRSTSSVLDALQYLRAVPGRIGLDIGATLAKMTFMQLSSECSLAQQLATMGRHHPELSFEVILNDKPTLVHFISGTTEKLGNMLMAHRRFPAVAQPRKVVASGGGAHRFANKMREVLNIEMLPLQEMESLVRGLDFLAEHGPEDELFTVGTEATEVPAEWPSPVYPCLIVNMGSGVSILRIDEKGAGARKFVRLGGTACGGATFLGLARLATSAASFSEALELARCGDPTRVNKLVRDIYGDDGCKDLGLPATLTAVSFGKVGSDSTVPANAAGEADLAAALLLMVVQESTVLTRAYSQLVSMQIGRVPPVFFTGGFLVADNTVARRIIANSLRNLALGPALFLRHSDFLGALGSLMQCVKNHSKKGAGDARWPSW